MQIELSHLLFLRIKKFQGFSNFCFQQKILWLWTTCENFYHTLNVARRGHKMCDRFQLFLHPQLERHSTAQENPTMTMIVLLWLLLKTILSLYTASLAWPDPSFAQGRYRFQYKRPARKRVWTSSQCSLGSRPTDFVGR